MANTDSEQRSVKTTHTVFEILEALQRHKGARVTELGEILDVSNSTVHRHLTALHECGYVVKEGDTYHVGLRFLDLGEHARKRKQAYQMARPKVEELAEETEERAQFIVEEHGYGVYVHRALGAHAVKTDPGIGKHVPIHATAAGKAILANLQPWRVEEIIDQRGLPAVTQYTTTSLEELLTELELIRERGYSINSEEHIEGLRAIGSVINSPVDQVVGALSISGPTHRMKGNWFEEELPDLVRGATNELELNIAYG